jgi:hypothetical protein
MCALGPCSSESRAGQDAQLRGGALPVNSSCSMPTATVLPSSILVVATCREDLHQRGHQGEVLVLGVLGGRRRGVGHAHVVAAGGQCVSGGSRRARARFLASGTPTGPAGTSPTGFGNPRARLRSTTRSPDRATVALVASGYPTVPPGVAKVHAGRGRRATRVRPRWGMSPTLGGRPSGTLHRRCDTDEVDGRGPVFLRDGSGPVRAHPSLIPHFLIPSWITGRERDRRCRAGGPPVLMRSRSPRVASGVWR